jgi:putative hydrolase of the HAD superfamily
MKRWISFDLDGTLMQNPFMKAVFPEIQTLIQERSGRDYDVIKALIHEHERRMRSGLTVAAYDWDDIVQHEIKQQGLSLSIDVESIVRKYCRAPYIHLLDETIVPALEQLRAAGFSIAAVTNGFYQYQFPVLEGLGIAQYFDEVATPERCGSGKPDTGMMNSLRETGEIAAHVGDRLEHDVYMANQAGIPSVFIHRKLPDELIKLPYDERARTAAFREICELKLPSELVVLQSSDELEPYLPEYVICDLQELVNIIDNRNI